MSASTTQPLGAIHNKTNRGRCILTKKTTTKSESKQCRPTLSTAEQTLAALKPQIGYLLHKPYYQIGTLFNTMAPLLSVKGGF